MAFNIEFILLLLLASSCQSAYIKQDLDPQDELATAPAASQTTGVPDYFQITPEIFAGPYKTGAPPFLAQTNQAPFLPSRSYVPNTPLQTSQPIVGNDKNESIFRLMGNLSPYFPNPEGWGVDEYPLPLNSEIKQVHMISRHGSRYPQTNSTQEALGKSFIDSVAAGNTFSNELEFLNNWSYKLGTEMLTRNGRKELFESGVLHYIQYGALWDPNTTIVARTTTQKRMRESAEYFLTGFFGLGWEEDPQIKLEFIIEASGFNNSLVAAETCVNANKPVSQTGTLAGAQWAARNLANATARLNEMSGNFNWTFINAFDAQNLCAYETVALGFSNFCSLFTFEEWQGFEYIYDIGFQGNSGFQSPTGRAVGAGYVQEVIGRLTNTYPIAANTSNNVTLDSMPSTFPLNQSLYFDFSHDSNIISVLTAFGLTQFSTYLPSSGPPSSGHTNIASRLSPFGTRLDIEIINSPHPVKAARSVNIAGGVIKEEGDYEEGGETRYVHFVLNQRTVPLGESWKDCGDRDDGWCEFNTFLAWQFGNLEKARYEYACFGNYSTVEYGMVKDGVPVS